MKTTFNTLTRWVIALGFVLGIVFSSEGAITYQKSKVIDTNGGTIEISTFANIPGGALNAYFVEQGINNVEITVQMQEVYANFDPVQELQNVIDQLQTIIVKNPGKKFVTSVT